MYLLWAFDVLCIGLLQRYSRVLYLCGYVFVSMGWCL